MQGQCSSEPDCWNDDTNNNPSSSNQQYEAIIQEFSVQNTKKCHTIYDSSNNNNSNINNNNNNINNINDDEKYNSNDSLEDISQITSK